MDSAFNGSFMSHVLGVAYNPLAVFVSHATLSVEKDYNASEAVEYRGRNKTSEWSVQQNM